MARLRVLGTLAALCLLLTALSGCESFSRGPAAVSREGSDLLVAVCVDLTISRIYGEASTDDQADFKFADLDGELEVTSGTVLNLSQPIEGLTGTIDALDLSELTEVLVTFRQGADDGFAASFGGTELLDLSDDRWLQTDGSTTEQPCS